MIDVLRDVSGEDCDEEERCGYSDFSASLQGDKCKAKGYLDNS